MAKNKLSKEKWKRWEERKNLILSYDFHLSDTQVLGRVYLELAALGDTPGLLVGTEVREIGLNKE